MQNSIGLEIGQEFEMTYVVPEDKTVPHLFPEAPEFQVMPKVFATGFAVGLVEWCCMKLINRYSQDAELVTLGANLDVVHCYPVVPGCEVVSWCRVAKISGTNLLFKVRASYDNQIIFEGSHLRSLMSRKRFDQTLDVIRSRVPDDLNVAIV